MNYITIKSDYPYSQLEAVPAANEIRNCYYHIWTSNIAGLDVHTFASIYTVYSWHIIKEVFLISLPFPITAQTTW